MRICNDVLAFLMTLVALVLVLYVITGCELICHEVVRLVLVCFGLTVVSVLTLWAAHKPILCYRKCKNHLILKFLCNLDVSLLLLVLSSSWLSQILCYEVRPFALPLSVGALYLSVFVTLVLLRD